VLSEATEYFSKDYFTARTRFRQATEKAGGRLCVIPLVATGPGNEDLTIDIACFGSEHPRKVLLHCSGLHGVEGFAGSAIQLRFLKEIPTLPDDAALVVIHVLNPYGMAWLRRFNENNVDLNRNFLGGGDYAGAPEKYPKLDSFLNPKSRSSSALYLPRAGWIFCRDGFHPVKQAIAGGQYEYPKGLFFGGKQLEYGPQKVQELLVDLLSQAEQLIAIDIHTGLGKFGEDTLLVENKDYSAIRAQFGERVVPMEPDQSPAYRVRGAMITVLPRLCPNARVMAVSQEFGTYGPLSVLRALREENRSHHHGGTVDHPTKRILKKAFCPDNEGWRLRVLQRGRELLDQASLLVLSKSGTDRAPMTGGWHGA
jgi:hypothetical protein